MAGRLPSTALTVRLIPAPDCVRCSALMPVRIREWSGTRRVELCDLCRRQLPTERAEILREPLFVARADDHAADGRALQQPVQRNLLHGLVELAATASSASATRNSCPLELASTLRVSGLRSFSTDASSATREVSARTSVAAR
jgi:hypothetical protein